MKNIISVIVITLLSFSAYAAESQDEQSMKICKELAQSHNLVAQDAQDYVSQCVKDIAEVEAEEREKEKS